jgi:hypothetical protein
VPICQQAWLALYGFSNNKMDRLKKLLKNGVEKPVHGNKDSVVLSEKRAMMVSFMKQYFTDNCDKMPDPSGCTDSWHLPHTATKEDVYQMYIEFFSSRGYDDAELGSSCYFKDVWRKEFPHVTIPDRSRFKQCTECVSPHPQAPTCSNVRHFNDDLETTSRLETT